ncbi:MAG TPA: efflux RND transporter periplasmic adaptor subunit [Chitinophagaceae bacterium]|nr:efflux RND transporter periplasmic adaptor subunit [Chitinophagaceae bacterium]
MNYKKINKTGNFKNNFKSVSRGQLPITNCLLLIAFCLLLIAIPSCKTKTNEVVATKNPDVYYTCSMHPQVMEEHPGNCPICGMKLIEAKKSQSQKPGEVQLSNVQMELGNIQVDTIRDGSIGNDMALTATLNFNQKNITAISARITGRVDHLYFKNIGAYVHKGDKLFDLYSEELNNAKQEYILAVQNQQGLGNSLIDYKQISESAKNKLLLWGMTENQINNLADAKKVSPLTSFYSTANGYITTLDIKEGGYVTEGGTIMQLADLSTLWAEAQVYTSQLSEIDARGSATVQIPDLNNLEIKGTISFVNPEVDPDARINLIRITIPNNNNQLHPGMPAYVYLKNRQHKGLTLPSNAVLRDSKSAMVWIKTGEHSFEVKMVETGTEDDNNIEITSGLKEGDVVVTSGAYLLNSEYIFKKGTDPMAGMDMSKM